MLRMLCRQQATLVTHGTSCYVYCAYYAIIELNTDVVVKFKFYCVVADKLVKSVLNDNALRDNENYAVTHVTLIREHFPDEYNKIATLNIDLSKKYQRERDTNEAPDKIIESLISFGPQGSGWTNRWWSHVVVLFLRCKLPCNHLGGCYNLHGSVPSAAGVIGAMWW